MKVGIIGASGYTGGELLRILSKHKMCEIVCATSRTFKGKVSSIHAHLRGIDIKFEDLSPEEVAERCDFAFTATPHGTSQKIVPLILEKGVKVIDLSGDFRLSAETYEKYYGIKHEHPEIKAVYGLPELHRREIKKAKLVANPGCYPTAVILGLAPLVKEGLIDVEKIAVDSKSGVSGAGAKPKKNTHYPAIADNVLPYKVKNHRHLPEIEKELRKFDPRLKISFVPHVVPVIRGITTTIHCFLSEDIHDLRRLYLKFYKEEPFIRILNQGEMPSVSAIKGSNFCDIGLEIDRERKRAIVVSVIDNLVKGASGQAVQNMNIMQRYEETEGLEKMGMFP